jgi:hypothetical protein
MLAPLASDTNEQKFTISAVRKDNPTPLLQMNLSWGRLMEDIVIPFDSGEMFFVDGAATKATELDRLKILLNGHGLDRAFAHINWNMRTGNTNTREMYAKQYPVFIEAILREHCDDVTSQVVSAYKTAIKPKLKDPLPDKKTLFEGGVKIFVEGMKAFAASQ